MKAQTIKTTLMFMGTLAMTAMMAGCSHGEKDTATAAPADSTANTAIVDIDLAVEQDVTHTASYTATAQAYNVNNISPASPNRIKTITVDVGDAVHRGQTLVTLDASQATQLKVNIEQIQREYDRAVQLLRIGSGTQAAVDQLKAQLDAQRTQYNNVLENTTLVSPIDGVVTARNYDPGDMTSTQPVLSVGQTRPDIKLVVNITEADRSKIAPGQEVTATFDAFPGRPFNARVSRIYPTVDPRTRTFEAEVLVPNPAGEIMPGMFGRVSMAQNVTRSVTVPDMAVVKQPGSGNRYVYVYNGGTVSYNRVELGERLDNTYEILSGVNPGDTVVISGQTRLSHGAPAKINPQQSQTK